MTLFRPSLKLNRLVSINIHGGKSYDENFHSGINIIRGQNSSGKSTIANFIFFVLGGDFNKWTTKAAETAKVYAEVELNGANISIKRNVTGSLRQPMEIFYGDLKSAMKSTHDGWNTYPYQQSSNKESFSNAIFQAMGFPEIKGEAEKNITMHQVLRLLYIDQQSLTLDLMRTEQFDPSLTRAAVSEVLLGVYDDILYSDRLKLKELTKVYDAENRKYEELIKIFGATGTSIDKDNIQVKIVEIENSLKDIEESLNTFYKSAYQSTSTKLNSEIQSAQDFVISTKKELNETLEKIELLEYDIFDSNNFVENLQRRLDALDESTITAKSLGKLPLMYCPSCLAPLKPQEKNICSLCKEPLSDEHEKSRLARLRQELQLQIKESLNLLKVKESKLNEFQENLPKAINNSNTAQRRLNEILNQSKSTRDEEIDRMLIQKGKYESTIEQLIHQQKTAEQLDIIKEKIITLRKQIESTRIRIRSKEEQKNRRHLDGKQTIERLGLNILRNDLDRQIEFHRGERVTIDFYGNSYALDGKNNFSASSNVYLKNSIRFAIFFASLELEYFRYPRFILCDNIEDKGMEPGRSQNFQRLLVELSSKYEVNHQIIFTTSMIDPELNKTPFCVGHEYTETNKSLAD